MAKIDWSNVGDRYYETGLDRGVLYPRSGAAVPWLGLVGVDENGADSAAAYYMDGRPFLHLPKPKEFVATIKAITYPDAFGDLMGTAEATPGMVLDSQQADAFGLSYRTLIGSATKGEEAGYKIHLVYNATVSPQAKSFSTLSDSINPVEFSWEVQAVPVAIAGYRSTAHVTIDTRNMDPEKLSKIEAMLYGDAETDPYMPTPQVLYDILHYGDTILITDNGDGTWTAEGAYYNLYLIDDGVFQIDNVNAVHHGDGTYTLSTGGNTTVQTA